MDHEPSLDSVIVQVQRDKKLRKDGQPRKPYTRKKVEKPVSPKGSPTIVGIKKTRKQKPKSSKPSEKEEKASSKPIGQEVVEQASPKSSEKGPSKTRRNEDYASMLEKLATIMQKRGDMIRYRTYKKGQETILGITEDIYEPTDVAGKPGIGPTILEKLKEFSETGTLPIIEREKANPENIFSDIYGVGPKKAKEIVTDKQITTIAQLREKQDEVLNDIQKIGLKYYEDILQPIPRAEIDEYAKVFKEVFDSVKTDEADHYEIVGSYRRGKSTSGDIDVILTSSDARVFTKWVDALLKRKIILEVLSRGKTKCLVITRLGDRTARRVDFLFSSPEEYPFAILYFTGSKGFNAAMRGHALKTGVSLNEHGFSKIVAKKKEEKLDVVMKSERDIFDYLGLEYKEPVERVDSRDVIVSAELLQAAPVHVAFSPATKPTDTNTANKYDKEKSVVEYCKEVLAKDEENKVRPSETLEKISVVVENLDMKTPPKTEVFESNVLETPKKESPKNKTIKRKKLPKDSSVTAPPKTKTIKKQSDLKTSPHPTHKPFTVANMTDADIEKTKTHIQQFKNIGISAIESLTQHELAEIIVLASDKYYNTINGSIMTDNEYDIVKEYMQTKFPANTTNQQIGAPIITGKNKVNLPYEMWSMDKIKPDSGALPAWVNKYKGPYVLSCKLDGVSGLYSTEGETPKLYTRGDGKVGQDISHLLETLKLPTTKGIVVRGEFLISKAVFESKYASQFANPRNLVSGIINAKAVAGKAVDTKAADLDFVTYEVVVPKLKPSEQLQKLTEYGFKVVEHKVETALSNELLSDYLVDMRKNHPYEIDGIIVTDDAIHPRVSGNPDHAFAFKMMLSDQKAEAKVVDVEWSPSKDGFLKPRVRIEPIRLGGVTITYATGYNAKFIEDNKIGVGALVELIRSGDVIPKILSTTVPAEKPKMPFVPYIWNETHVDILLENASEDRTVQEKNVTAFFTELEVDGLKAGNVRKIMDAGFETVPKILRMTEADFKTAGFKSMAPKYVENIAAKVGEASLLNIMVASGKLGRGLGERKLGPIMEAHPDILVSQETPAQKIVKVKTVAGIEQKSAQLFVENISAFLAFLKECGLENKLTEKVAAKPAVVFDQSHPFYGKDVVMTKFRDKYITAAVEDAGGKVSEYITANTLAVIVKSETEESNKTKEAVKKGVPIMTLDEFKKKYMNLV